MKYIDADKLKRDLEEYKKRLDELYPRLECEDDRLVCGASASELNVVASMIDDAPTADVVEVRHGEWIINDEDYWTKCSVCEFEYFDEQEDIYNTYRYCPHCGARMDGDDGETV